MNKFVYIEVDYGSLAFPYIMFSLVYAKSLADTYLDETVCRHVKQGKNGVDGIQNIVNAVKSGLLEISGVNGCYKSVRYKTRHYISADFSKLEDSDKVDYAKTESEMASIMEKGYKLGKYGKGLIVPSKGQRFYILQFEERVIVANTNLIEKPIYLSQVADKDFINDCYKAIEIASK